LGDDKDIEDLKQKSKNKKLLEKRTELEYLNHLKRAKVHTPLITMDLSQKQEEEEIEQFRIGVKEEIAAEIPNDCFRQKFEKYEYLMKKGTLTKKEQEWIEEYKQTDEYEQIYGDESDKEVFNAQIICKNA
jgi:hypothetical protein